MKANCWWSLEDLSHSELDDGFIDCLNYVFTYQECKEATSFNSQLTTFDREVQYPIWLQWRGKLVRPLSVRVFHQSPSGLLTKKKKKVSPDWCGSVGWASPTK